MKKFLFILAILATSGLAQAQWQVPLDSLPLPPTATAIGVKCWFDQDTANTQTMSMANDTTSAAAIDASAIPSGLHVVHFQPFDSLGHLYPSTSAMFVNMIYMNASSAYFRCYFDNDIWTSRSATIVGGLATVDASDLGAGLHTMTCYYTQGNTTSVTYSTLFVSTQYTDSAMTLEYWFDESATRHTVPFTADLATIDASNLSQGLHTLHYRTQQGDAESPIYSTLFNRIDNNIVTLYYGFDTSQTYQQATFTADGITQLDASALDEGTHLLNLMAQGFYGTYTPADNGSFYRYVCPTDLMATETVTACDSFYWFGTTYTASTSSPTYTVVNDLGCDSTILLNLTINYSTHKVIYDTAEGSYMWEGQTLTESGEYTVYYETAEGCDSVLTLVLTIAGEESITVTAADGILFYPNPTTGRLTISGNDVLAIDVYDNASRHIATFSGTNQLDLTDLPSGLYMLRVTTPTGTTIQRIIKQ